MTRWKLLLAVAALALLWPLARVAWAATDAFFAGRALRMTRVAAATSKCSDAAYSCLQYDDATPSRPRYWNGSVLTQVITTPSPAPNTGAILYGNGTNWIQLPPGSNGQVLTIAAGVPSWATP